MRKIERYTKNIVVSQPDPPRQCSWWFIFLHAPGKHMLLGVLCVVVLWIAVELKLAYQPLRSLKYYVFLSCFLIGLPMTIYKQIVTVVYKYVFGISYGKNAKAHIVNVEHRMGKYNPIAFGVCEVLIGDIPYHIAFELDNFRSGSWIEKLKVGDVMQVLLHPQKPDILIILGIAD